MLKFCEVQLIIEGISEIKDWLLKLYISLKEMPSFLGFIVIIGLFGILVIAVAIIPYGSYAVNNKPLGYAQFWEKGYGPLTVILGLYLLMMARGLMTRKPWSRFAALFLWLGPFIFGCIKEKPSVMDVLPAFPVFLFLIWYLFFKKTVKEYFFTERGSSILQANKFCKLK